MEATVTADAGAAENPSAPPNPEMQMVFDYLTEFGAQPIPELFAQEARSQPTPADAVLVVVEERRSRCLETPLASWPETSPVRMWTAARNAAHDWIVENSGDFKAKAERLRGGGRTRGGNLALNVADRAYELIQPDHVPSNSPIAGDNFETPATRRTLKRRRSRARA